MERLNRNKNIENLYTGKHGAIRHKQKHREFIQTNMVRLNNNKNIREFMHTEKHGAVKPKQKHREFIHRKTWSV